MTIYRTPKLTADDLSVIKLINEQKQRLKYYIQNDPQRWDGLMRRNLMARAIQGSNTIEGYNATMDDVIAAIEDQEPMSTDEATWREIRGYRNAMTYVLQLSADEHFEYHNQLLRSLHFMLLQHNMDKMPGRWRPGEIYVFNEILQKRVYKGPDPQYVSGLIDELVEFLNNDSDCPTMVKAAMAHLNFTMIHPFKDGNGRMARALQTLVLSRDGIISPIFSSIEEWLGRNTNAYYEILAETGKGSWHPENDAHAWIKFCLKAHYQQAHTIVKRNEWFGQIFGEVLEIQETHKLPDRSYSPLMDGAMGLQIRAGRYREQHDISDVIASRDLRKMCDLELLIPHGERRGRFYTGSIILTEIAAKHKVKGKSRDPYELVQKQSENEMSPRLPL